LFFYNNCVCKTMFSKLLLLVIIPVFLWPQNFAGADFGGTDFHISDAHASPLFFRSIGITPTVQFIHMGENGIHNFEASYYNNDLSSLASNFTTASWRAAVKYSYMTLVAAPGFMGKALNLYIGGSAGTFYCKQDYYYYYIPEKANAIADVSWIWSHSLDLSFAAYYNIAEREFVSAQMDIPLISNISRPQYSSSLDFNYTENVYKLKMFGTTELFTDYFSMDIRLNFQHPLIGNFNVQINYEFYYSFYNKPSDINMYMNNFRGGLFYCF
jgi:hypothetical protein